RARQRAAGQGEAFAARQILRMRIARRFVGGNRIRTLVGVGDRQRAARPRIGKADAASRRQHTLGGERGVAGKREVRSGGGRTATAPSTAGVCIDILLGGGVQIGGG